MNKKMCIVVLCMAIANLFAVAGLGVPTPPELTATTTVATPVTTPALADFDITATLTETSTTDPVVGETIQFTFYDTDGTTVLATGTDTTNASGEATYTVLGTLIDVAGSYSFKAYFAGTATYDYSMDTATVTVGYSLTVTVLPVEAVAAGCSVTKSPLKTLYSEGESVTLTAVEATGWTFDSWGSDLTGSTNPDTITMDGNKTVTATFTLNTYIITPSAGANGSIDPSGAVTVDHGADQAFTITPATGYEIADVTVDTSSVLGEVTIIDGVGTYTFTNVTAVHTIHATFALKTYTITVTAGANGSITPAGPVTVNHGANQAFTITPDANYEIADVTVDGSSVGAVTTHTFTNVIADHTISATFAPVAVPDNIGVFRPSVSNFYLDYDGDGSWSSGVDKTYNFGVSEDLPIAGDWDGVGGDEIGVFRPSNQKWYVDYNGDGDWDGGPTDDIFGPFGVSEDRPIAGDWNGNGVDEIGVFRPSTQKWYLDDGDGDWDAATDTTYGPFGISEDKPIAGDWDGDGSDEIGVFRPSVSNFYLDYDGDGSWSSGVDKTYNFGVSEDLPIAGHWQNGGLSSPLSVKAAELGSGYQVLCFPNPASVGGEVTFQVMGAGVNAIQVSIYDLGGGLVYQSELVSGQSVTWDLRFEEGTPVANGIYLYAVAAKVHGELISTKVGKLLILR